MIGIFNLLRVLRLLFGVSMIVQAYVIKSLPIGLLGGILLFQGVTNTGCCGGGTCGVPLKQKENDNNEIEYEEVK